MGYRVALALCDFDMWRLRRTPTYCVHNPAFSHFSRKPTCHRRTDGRTHDDS